MEQKNVKLKKTLLMKMLQAGRHVVGSMEDDMQGLLEYRRDQEAILSSVVPIIGVKYAAKMIDCGDRSVRTVWAIPEHEKSKKPVILYCHGGGYRTGGEQYAKLMAGKLAKRIGYRTVAHLYRLSPESKYPAAIEDTLVVWDFLLSRGLKPQEIIVAGDSAGGNLALELCLRLKEAGRELPKALVLFSPWTDMTLQSESYELLKDADPILNKEYIDTARKNYAGERDDFEKPEFSPLYGDLTGFPPTLIQVGSHEILQDDSVKLADKLEQAGVFTKLETYHDCWHVFQSMPIPEAGIALKKAKRFLRRL